MKIVLFCNNHEQYSFFRRCMSGLNTQGCDGIFLSHRLSVAIRARKHGFKVRLLSGKYYAGDGKLASDANIAFEVRQGLLTLSEARSLVRRVEAFTHSFIDEVCPDQIWFWDGCNLMRQTIAYVARQYNVKTLFFQLGNFPGKLFVDPLGVNVRSLYSKVSRFIEADNWVDWEKHRSWKENYLAEKLRSHHVPQSSSLLHFNWSYLFDLFGFYVLGAVPNERPRPITKLLNFFKGRFIRLRFDRIDNLPDGSFVLFPLQVNAGSQVLWNSNVGQLDAIRWVAKNAKSNNTLLVVKPHPVEDDAAFLLALMKLKNEVGFFLVGGDLFQLLARCNRVATLNSTAGLEAMLIGKPTEILGNAHYSAFSEADLAFYIQCFLIEADCFGSENFTEEQIRLILQRADHSFYERFGVNKSLYQ